MGVPKFLLAGVTLIILSSMPLAGFGSQTISPAVVGLRVIPVISLDQHRFLTTDNTQFNYLDVLETAVSPHLPDSLAGIARMGLLPIPGEFKAKPTPPPPRR